MTTQILVILLAEAAWSWLASMATIKTVSRKKWQVLVYDTLSLIIAYFVLATIARNDWPIALIIPAIAGNVVGTFIVASRKKKRKKAPPRRRFPSTTA